MPILIRIFFYKGNDWSLPRHLLDFTISSLERQLKLTFLELQNYNFRTHFRIRVAHLSHTFLTLKINRTILARKPGSVAQLLLFARLMFS